MLGKLSRGSETLIYLLISSHLSNGKTQNLHQSSMCLIIVRWSMMLKNKEERTSFLRNEKNWEVEYLTPDIKMLTLKLTPKLYVRKIQVMGFNKYFKKVDGIRSLLSSFILMIYIIVLILPIQNYCDI